MKIHPLADRFPMMAEDELDALAASIKEHGLRHPILVADVPNEETGEVVEMIVDGRNRAEACRRAEVEPTFQKLNGVDIAALILAENVERRNLSPGQRAMARAMLTKAQPGKRNDLAEEEPRLNSSEVSRSALYYARFVLRREEQLALSVLSGAVTLNAAYEQCKEHVETVVEEESENRSALDALRKRYPDLARAVEDGRDLDDALAEADKKDEQARNQRSTAFRAVRQAVESLAVLAFESDVAKWIRDHPDEFEAANPLGLPYLAERREHVPKGAAALKKIISKLKLED